MVYPTASLRHILVIRLAKRHNMLHDDSTFRSFIEYAFSGERKKNMRIITISRQFGSGGRELGERLAKELDWDYYDKEIIESLVEKHDLDEEYVREILSRHGWHHIQLTYRHSFSQLMINPTLHINVLLRQSEIIREIAAAGNDCVIVGRDADVILHELNVDYEHLGVNKPQTVTLAEDGTISGAYAGTWSLTDGTPYIDLVIDGVTYSGVTLEMEIENTNVVTMTFTALGESNQLTIWGSKAVE